jgi:transglutaminase-like putative cysteine protease
VSRYRVSHTTLYRYSGSVSLCHSEAHLVPRSDGPQQLVMSAMVTRPFPAVCHDREDFFGNRTSYFAVEVPHDELEVRATSEVTVAPPMLRQTDGPAWEAARDVLAASGDASTLDARQFLLASPFVAATPGLRAYAEPSFTPARPLLEAVADLVSRIHREFAYDPHFSTIATPVDEVLAHRRGVCQDFAHLTIGCLRSVGIPARYVSGYLETDPPPGQPKLQGADASHAWVSAFVPGSGWFDFDPTNDQSPDDHYITLAWGRDYGDVTPLKGVLLGGGEHELTVAVDVQRLDDVPG